MQSATLNGTNWTRNCIAHADILNGGTLVLSMGPAPSAWGTGTDDVPTSLTVGSGGPSPLLDRTQGGVITASGENPGANEGKDKAFDNDSGTKWLVFASTGWIQYQLASPVAVGMYTVTSANDAPGRDPRSWTLLGSNNGSSWTVVDQRTNESFPRRHQTRNFSCDSVTAYRHYRLDITENHGDNITQLAEIELFDTGRNLALHKPVTVSSTHPGGHVGANAVDGASGTHWESAHSDPQWISVDLGAFYDVSRLKITWDGAYGEDYLVQVSDDASTWTTLKTVTGNATLVNDHTGLSGSGRHVRLYGTARATAFGYSVTELEVYGTFLSAPVASVSPGLNTPVISVTPEAIGSGGFRFSWPATPGVRYRIECSPDLTRFLPVTTQLAGS